MVLLFMMSSLGAICSFVSIQFFIFFFVVRLSPCNHTYTQMKRTQLSDYNLSFFFSEKCHPLFSITILQCNNYTAYHFTDYLQIFIFFSFFLYRCAILSESRFKKYGIKAILSILIVLKTLLCLSFFCMSFNGIVFSCVYN